MKIQQPIIREDDEHRVLRFVPRNSATLPHHPTVPGDSRKAIAGESRQAVPGLSRQARSAVPDLSRYDQASDEPDDFRHRMLANTAAFAFTALLVGVGIWLAVSIADLRKTQDCVLVGRRDCAPIAAPRG